MTRKRARLLQASAALGATGAGVVLAAGPAAAAGPTVKPTTGLHDGQSVSVTWTPDLSGAVLVQAFECSGPVPSGPIFSILNQCDGLTAATLQQMPGSAAYQGSIFVRKSIDPPSGAVTCTNQCTVVVVASLTNVGDSSGSVPITFK